jgi:aminomethyltransferase
MNNLQKLELHEFHLGNSAKFTPFAGWDMPVAFGRSIEEHMHTRENASLFDVSHMGEIKIQGKDASLFLDYVLTNEVKAINIGKALYSPICTDAGGVLDDLIVYKRAEDRFFLCVNASNVDRDFEHFLEQKNKVGFDCEISNVSANWGQLAIQGPLSAQVLFAASGIDFGELPKMSFREINLFGGHSLVARTGYTGEDGFEVYCPAENLPDWANAFEEERSSGIVRWAGLAARDSLRLEAGFPLYGHELSLDITPLQAGLGWAIKWQKNDFLGKKSLLEEKERGLPGKVVFYEVDDRRIPRQGDKILLGDAEVGRVLSGGYSPMIEKPIGSAWLDISVSGGSEISEFSAEVRGNRVVLRPTLPVLRKLRKSPGSA